MATRIIIERRSLSTSNGGTPSGVTDGGLEDFDIPHQSLSATASPRRSPDCRKSLFIHKNI